jgi:hypothetical protein
MKPWLQCLICGRHAARAPLLEDNRRHHCYLENFPSDDGHPGKKLGAQAAACCKTSRNRTVVSRTVEYMWSIQK